MMMRSGKFRWTHRLLVAAVTFLGIVVPARQHDYGDALSKSIQFFEGQRSGRLPAGGQRTFWRGDSALYDGHDLGVDLVGGYYDAGDNVKFNFPMAFTTTMLAWSALEYETELGSELENAKEAIRWATDYLMKATRKVRQGVVYVQVGDPNVDHICWQRPEDMTANRPAFSVTAGSPGTEICAEMAAALAASSLVFKSCDPKYSSQLLRRAMQVFDFANNYRGSIMYSNVKAAFSPFYCTNNGYEDELLWAAAWLFHATDNTKYLDYVETNVITTFQQKMEDGLYEFGWDAKHAGINVLMSKIHRGSPSPFVGYANKFVCSVFPKSPSVSLKFSRGGLLINGNDVNMQHVTAISFLMLTYGRVLAESGQTVPCGNNFVATPADFTEFVKSQVDYVLGDNPMKMSYMVGYGGAYPKRIHHRGSSLPSVYNYPEQISCGEAWTKYFPSKSSNPNELTGALVGGPGLDDVFDDTRLKREQTEPATYVNAPFVGVLAYFSHAAVR